MKKKKYVDYTEASEYFTDDDKTLRDEIESVEKSKRFVIWSQEFSKRVVTVAFFLYIATTIFSLVIVYISFKEEMISGIDTLITETNQTFREIVGGYIIKSAVENAVKIGGNYYVGVSDAKLRALKERLQQKGIISDIENTPNNEDEFTEEDETL
jgi:hypothetical protein